MASTTSIQRVLLFTSIGGILFLAIFSFAPFGLSTLGSDTKLTEPVSNQPFQKLVTDQPDEIDQNTTLYQTAGTITEGRVETVLGAELSEQPIPNFSMRLKIPSINVDAAMESVGLTTDGDMDVPKGSQNTAWYNLGPWPGEPGSAVVAGHSGWGNGVLAVFDNLYKLRPGDKVYIEEENGTIVTFVVRELRTYDPSADASEVFGSTDGKAHLNLITCAGDWNEAQKSYSDRLVVFTDKE